MSSLAGMTLVSATCLCFSYLAEPPAAAQPSNDRAAIVQARGLTPERAAELERQLEKEPDDLTARSTLLSYYFLAKFQSDEARAAHAKHVLWIIEHHPEAPIAGMPPVGLDKIIDGTNYDKARKLWKAQVEANPANTAILGNAAAFFMVQDHDEAERLLLIAQKLNPEDPEWSQRLGHLYSLCMFTRRGEPDPEASQKAFTWYERSLKNMAPAGRYAMLADIAKAAYAAGEHKKAAQYATELLDRAVEQTADWNYGNAVHHGNLVLGRIALSDGKVEEAEAYLLKAGKTPGSPQLNSFGPNMQLALELLEKGRTEAVKEYLKLCGKFWKQSKLDTWSAQIEKGVIPDFGANLRY